MSSNQNSYIYSGQPTNIVSSYSQPTNIVSSYSQPTNKPTNIVSSYSQPTNIVSSYGQPTNIVSSYGQPTNNNWKLTRLTAKVEPNIYDSRFDFDSLQN